MWASTERGGSRGRLSRIWVRLALGAALIGLPTTALAAVRAEVNVHGSAEETHQLEGTLRSLFSADAELRVTAVEAIDGAQVMRESITVSGGDVVARAWIELHDGSRVTIYVADATGERILVRHLPRGEQDDELVRESTARVVATALEALESGAQIGVERAELGAELAPPVAAAAPSTLGAPARAPAKGPSRPPFAFALGAGYGLQWFSKQVPLVQGPGLFLGGSDRAHRVRLGALLSGQLWWSKQASDDVATVRLYSGALRLLATLERDLSEAVALQAALGGGVDLTRVEPSASGAFAVRVAPPKTLVTPALRAALGARFRPSYALSLYATLALDADPSGTRYVSINDGVTTPLLEPHVLRPSLVVGVATP